MTEKELLRMLDTIKEFRNILLGHEIKVFTDDKDLTYETIESSSQHVQLWMILIQEFGATLPNIKEEDNLVSDAFNK